MILITIVAVGVFVLALSLTQIFRGHDIRGEVGTNPHMQRLGLSCPLEDEGGCHDSAAANCSPEACATCVKNELSGGNTKGNPLSTLHSSH